MTAIANARAALLQIFPQGKHCQHAYAVQAFEALERAELHMQEAEDGRQYWMHEALGRDTEGDDRDGELRRLAEENKRLRKAAHSLRNLVLLHQWSGEQVAIIGEADAILTVIP